MNDAIWGIDLGGTKIEGVVLPANNKAKPLVRHRIDTEAEKGYEHVLRQIATLVKGLKDKSGKAPTLRTRTITPCF